MLGASLVNQQRQQTFPCVTALHEPTLPTDAVQPETTTSLPGRMSAKEMTRLRKRVSIVAK